MRLPDTFVCEFVTHAARTLFVDSYADTCEYARESEDGFDVPMAGPGEDWMDVAPETPDEAYILAARFLGRLEEANNASIYHIWERAEVGDGHRKPPTLEEFAHTLVMEALGHGVSWEDDHPPVLLPNVGGEGFRPLKIPELGSMEVDLMEYER